MSGREYFHADRVAAAAAAPDLDWFRVFEIFYYQGTWKAFHISNLEFQLTALMNDWIWLAWIHAVFNQFPAWILHEIGGLTIFNKVHFFKFWLSVKLNEFSSNNESCRMKLQFSQLQLQRDETVTKNYAND